MSPNAQQTAAALVDLACAVAATSEADTYDDGTPIPPSVTLHRPSAAVVDLLTDIGRRYPGIAMSGGDKQVISLDFVSAWLTFFVPAGTVIDADAPADFVARALRDHEHRTRASAAIVAIAISPSAGERQAIPVVAVDDTDPDYFAGGRADAMKALRGRSPVYRRTEYGSREDRSYDRGWNAVIDAWKPSDREDAEASRGDHEREMRRERDLGGEG